MYHQILQTAKHMQGTQIFGVLQFLKTSDQYSTKSYLITVNETENFLCCYTC